MNKTDADAANIEDKRSPESKYWLAQIEAARKWSNEWYTRGEAVNKLYIDERGESDQTRMNVLWSNVETIKPALYAKTPSPDVSRRYRDKDPVGKWAAIVLERALDYQFSTYDFDYAIRAAVQDYLLSGRGQVWARYEPSIKSGVLAWECCANDHVNWKDFLYSPARTWTEVTWVARRTYKTKEYVKERFGREIAEQLVFTDKRVESDQHDGVQEAAIWEIWDSDSKQVYFVSKNCPKLLQEPSEPFLNFEGFFPCPRPLMATLTTEKYLPTPDFCQYQNQAEEINLLSNRIHLLCGALRVIGVYDASQSSLGRIFENTQGHAMIPCETWAVLGAAGGIKGAVDFFPLEQVIKALAQCYESRERAKQAMYEITGISDIVRGASDPNETLGAQQIKTQWGSLRIRDRQMEVQRFVRDIVRLNAEIVAENFQPETLRTVSNVPLLSVADKQAIQAQQAQMAQSVPFANRGAAQSPQLPPEIAKAMNEPSFDEVFALLRNEKLRKYRIGIETDSTIQSDEMEEKAQRSEFVGAATQFVTAWGPIVSANPKIAPLASELLKFAVRGFKTAETLETAIDEAMDSVSDPAMTGAAPPPPPPDPKIALERERMERDMAERDKDRQHEMMMKQADIDARRADAVSVADTSNTKITEPIISLIKEAATGSQAANEASLAATAELRQAIDALAQLISAPKKIDIKRDAAGKIIGGTATPMRMN